MKKIVVIIVVFLVANIMVAKGQSNFNFGGEKISYAQYREMKKDIEKDLVQEQADLKNKIEEKTAELKSNRNLSQEQKSKILEEYISEDKARVAALKDQIISLRERYLGNSKNSFSGKSVSVRKGSQAYATVMDANGRYEVYQSISKSMVNGGSGQINPSTSQFNCGLAGIIDNQMDYDMLVKIYNLETGKLEKAYSVGAKQTKLANLMPGRYSYTLTIKGRTSDIINFDAPISVENQADIKGNVVYWAILKQEYSW